MLCGPDLGGEVLPKGSRIAKQRAKGGGIRAGAGGGAIGGGAIDDAPRDPGQQPR
jgi:hypothetical protein